MDCKEFREILDLYVDQELSPGALGAAQTHLNECHSCRRAEEQLLRLRVAMKLAVSQHQPPPDLANVVQRITRRRWLGSSGIRNETANDTGASRARYPLWRENILLPVPIFALLFIGVVTLGILLLQTRMPKPGERVSNREATSTPSGVRPSIEASGLSRFDHGGRASLYKVPR
jgi:hypothetical protein